MAITDYFTVVKQPEREGDHKLTNQGSRKGKSSEMHAEVY
jgi:hypothetical protein